MAPSATVENYLKALHDAEHELGPQGLVPVGLLASRLAVTPGTATAMAKTLAEAGLVRYQPYMGLRLTRAGRRLAVSVVRRHRLVELFLVRVLGMNWSEVHEEADRLEHALSDRVIEKMDALLGHPEVDPHGDPIPLADGTVAAVPDTTLLTCPLREPVTVSRIADQGAEFLDFAERHALVPGTELRVESRDETGDRVTLRAGPRRIVLGARAATKVMVRRAGLWLLCALLPASAPAQPAPPAAHAVQSAPDERPTVGGRLQHSLSGDPVADALVDLAGTSWSGRTRRDGSFSLTGMPPGRYLLRVRADGFVELRIAVTVEARGAAPLDLRLDPLLEFSDAVSVSAETRSRFEAAQPTAVLSGQELGKQLEGSLGAALRGQLGVAERSSGPGASRPVIRGLDGDRVLILQDTHGMGDVSSQSADHGVSVNPATASRIEVIRGPATLLYGSNAIGGLVNIVTNTIPTDQRAAGAAAARGLATVDVGSGTPEAGAAVSTGWRAGRLAFQASGAARRSGDVGTPDGRVANTEARSVLATVAASWVGSRGYVGGSYGFDDGRYGLPAVGGGAWVTLTPRRHGVTARGEWRDLPHGLGSLRVSAVRRAYAHDEIEGGAVGTRFTNDLTEVTAMMAHRPMGRLSGTVGASGSWRAFSAVGVEALSPPVDQASAALFGFEEARWGRVSAQGGVRVETTRYRPARGRPPRDFTDVSLSGGGVWRLAEPVTLTLSVASASRRPALEELYFDGLHIGNFAYEVGSAALGSERALGVDASLRWRVPRVSGELTWFRNAIDGFIFREPTGSTVKGFPVVHFVARDAALTGVEARADVQIASGVVAEVAVDGTRGTLSATREALPRIPPLRARLGARVQHLAWQAGAEVTLTARQARVYRHEPPTAGSTVLRLFSSWSFGRGTRLHTLTVRLDNAADTLHRNHLSYLKDAVAERGRSARVVHTMAF